MSKPFQLSVKALVRDAQGRYLLLQRSAASRNNAGKWDMPGGKVDPGEAFDDALRREVHEETGLDVVLERPVGVAHSDLPDRVVAYLMVEARVVGSTMTLSSEHANARWVARADLPSIDLCAQFATFARAFALAPPGG